MKGKHAYLIMCHTNFDQLMILLELLDDVRNDIFLHIDKKAEGYSLERIRNSVKKSMLFLVNPMRINWGGDSQIELEMKLLREATKQVHEYYHLISGLDLPLKTQEDIHFFFANQCGYDFVSLEWNHPHNQNKTFLDRLNYYYPLQNYIQRGKEGIFGGIQRKLLTWQKKHNICRTRNAGVCFQKGANWFSITHKTACYIVTEYKHYKKYFRKTLCGDEIFLQTILVNSPFLDNVVDDNLRFVDWNRGNPYTFTDEDYEVLINSDKLFARKFDLSVDRTIVFKIRDSILRESGE